MNVVNVMKKIFNYLKPLALKTKHNAIAFFSIMIPVLIVLKIIQELNCIEYLVYPFIPLMKLLDIPSIYALAWLGGILNNNYTTFSLIVSFFKDNPLTYEQLSLLGLISLIAHSLFIEGMLTYKLKLRIVWSIVIRLCAALVLAYIIHLFCASFNLLQDVVNNPILSTRKIFISNLTLLDIINQGTFKVNFIGWFSGILLWLALQIKMLVSILLIMFMIFVVVNILKDLKFLSFVEKLSQPIFRLLHISKSNTTVTLICFLTGLAYSWGLLQEESKNNIFFKNDQSFKILTFLLLIHSVVEDTLVFIVLGGSIVILFVARFIWAIFIIYILGKFVLPKLSKRIKKKYLYY